MNKQQREFKRQMQESLLEVKKENEEKYYDYIKWNNLEDVESRKRREFKEKIVKIVTFPFKSFLRIAFFLIIISSVLGAFSRLTDFNSESVINNSQMSYSAGHINDQQKSIINYFDKIKAVRLNFSQLIDKRNADMKNLNNGSLTKKQYADNLLVYQNGVASNLKKLNDIECPAYISDYKNTLTAQYTILNDLLNNEICYYNFGNKSYLNKVKEDISNFNSKNEESDTEFNRIKDEYNLN